MLDVVKVVRINILDLRETEGYNGDNCSFDGEIVIMCNQAAGGYLESTERFVNASAKFEMREEEGQQVFDVKMANFILLNR